MPRARVLCLRPIAVARDRKNYNATKIAVDKWFAGEPPPAVEPDQRITNEWLADWDARLKLLEEQK